MPRICTVCASPKRAEIDKRLATGVGAKRRIAAQYGLTEQSIRRHEAGHLEPRLIAAHEKALAVEDMTARDVIVEAVSNLREDMRNTRGVHAGQYLDVIDRLVRANDQFARINKELGADQVTTFLIGIGVRNEEEARRAVQIAGIGREVSLEDSFYDALELMRFAIAQKPELRQSALRILEREPSGAVVLESENGGHDDGSNGSGQRLRG